MPRNKPVGSHVSVTPKPAVVPRLGNGLTQSQMDDYSSLISQYKGIGFDKLLEANPYLSANREKSGWERFLSSLGVRTNYDVDLDQNAQAVREYAAQVVQNAREEKYNSEAEQVKRAGQAGLNADLAGVNNAQATEFAQEQTSPQFAGSDQEQFSKICSSALDIYTLVMGFSKDLQSLSVLQNQVNAGEIQNASSMLDFALKASQTADDTTMYSTHEHGLYSDAYFLPFFRSKRQRRNFRNAFDVANFSPQTTLFAEEFRNKYFGAKVKNAQYRSSQYFSMEDRVMDDLFSPIVRYAEENAKLSLSRERKAISYDEQRLGALDPEASAEAENAANKSAAQSANIEYDTKSVWSDILDNLYKDYNKGNRLAGFGIIAINIMQALASSVHGGYNSGQKEDKEGVLRSQSGMSLGF